MAEESADSVETERRVVLRYKLDLEAHVDMSSYIEDGRQMTEDEIRDYEMKRLEDGPEFVQDIYETAGLVDMSDPRRFQRTVQVTIEDVPREQ